MEYPVDSKTATEVLPLEIEYKGMTYTGKGIPLKTDREDGLELAIIINNEDFGIIRSTENGWKMDTLKDKYLVNAIGNQIFLWFEWARSFLNFQHNKFSKTHSAG